MIGFVADVQPFRALRYASGLDLSSVICPPFDTISPQLQRALHERSPYNAVRLELAEDTDGRRYQRAADTLSRWRDDGTLRQEAGASFYLYRQTFIRDPREYARTALFTRLRLEPWDKGIIRPHEQTFGGPKEDRLKLLRATHINSSPVYLIYADAAGRISGALAGPAARTPDAAFSTTDGQTHALWVISHPDETGAISDAFQGETLVVADGHHRYETALGYRDATRADATQWTGQEPENFALAALTAADDPGLLVLPIHRVTLADMPLKEALDRLTPVFSIEQATSEDSLLAHLAQGDGSSVFGLISAESEQGYVLTLKDAQAADRLLPQDRSADWRRLDYAIANHIILRHALGLQDSQMKDYSMVWFTEDAREAAGTVRSGRARYAALLNPVPVDRIIAVAASGERMPQKSTFFYPKIPTGLVFNPVED